MRSIISRIYPGRLKDHVQQLLLYNGIEHNTERVIGVISGMAFVISLLAAQVIFNLHGILQIISIVPLIAVVLTGAYIHLTLRANKRGRFVESLLPSTLKLMSSNLKAGLNVDKALLLATRPEFGFFRKEIKKVAYRIAAGESFEKSLKKMSKSIKSKNLEITIDLIAHGTHSGGKLADSLNRIADILKEREFVKKEIRAGVQMYISLIMFAILFGAPLLFGISSFLIELLQTMTGTLSSTGMPDTAGTFTGMNNIGSGHIPAGVPTGVTPMSLPVSIEFIKLFSMLSLVSTSIMGSIVIGLIASGNWRDGIKYMPVFCTISLVLFFIVNKTMVMTIGNMMT